LSGAFDELVQLDDDDNVILTLILPDHSHGNVVDDIDLRYCYGTKARSSLLSPSRAGTGLVPGIR